MDFAPFLYHDNRLSVNFKEGSYYYRYKFPQAPRFTPLEEEALRYGYRQCGRYEPNCRFCNLRGADLLACKEVRSKMPKCGLL